MEIHQLRYVLAIADQGNFTRAAQAANIAQPSLSQQISKLESELGHKLFHRLGRKAVPTEAGATFLRRARSILLEVENATKEIRDDPAMGRRLTIGAVPTLAPYLLPPLINRSRTQFPNLQIFAREGFRSDLVQAVLEGELDFALVPQPLRDPRLSIEPIFHEHLLLVVGKNHRLARQPVVRPADLKAETFVMLGAGSTLATQVQRFCGDHDFQPRIGYRCVQTKTLKAFVSEGLGIAILPQIARNAEDRKTLAYRELSGGSPRREIVLIRHLQRYQSRAAGQLIQLLREELGSTLEPAAIP